MFVEMVRLTKLAWLILALKELVPSMVTMNILFIILYFFIKKYNILQNK